MRFWLDTEFIEDGRTIELVSVGIVAEDERRYYAELAEADLSRASPWVRENVLPYLTGHKLSRAAVADALREMLGDAPEVWAWFGSYDWVALCQLYGSMVELPRGWPMFVRDVEQVRVAMGRPDIQQMRGQQHNALADAEHVRVVWQHLRKIERTRTAFAGPQYWMTGP